MQGHNHTSHCALSIPDLLRSIALDLEAEALTSSSSLSRKEQLCHAEASLSAILSRIRSDINACAPISSLPEELLATILLHVMVETIPTIRLPAPYYSSSWPKRQHYLTCIVLVCRAWRDLVLNSPLFWSELYGDFPASMNLSIQRSGSAPLSLYLTQTYARKFCMTDRLQEHFDRLRSLHIDRTEFVLPCGRAVSPWTEFTAPRLECFTYIGMEGIEMLESRLTMKLLFVNRVSCLKALALVNNGPWLPSNSFPRLTHLYLSPTPYSPPSFIGPWLDGLLEILANAPSLLILHVWLQEKDDQLSTNPSPRHSVNLPHLRVCTLQSESPPVAWYILSHLSIPTETLVRLHWRSGIPRDNGRSTMHALSPYTTLVVSVMRVHIDVLLTNTCTNAGLWIQQLVQKLGLQWQSFLSNLHITCPLSSVECMRLYADGWDVIPIAGILPHMPSLKELYLSLAPNLEVEDFVPLITGICDAFGRDEPPICPALRLLCIEVNISNAEVGWAESLLNMASRRARAGCKLQRVALQPIPKCDFAQLTREELQALLMAEGRAFSNLTKYVDAVEIRAATDMRLVQCQFRIGDRWDLEEAERYWQVDGLPDKPAYELERSD
ncbi:hypothetical protein L227DRAFT_656062 [Lentinus tigrinus ALCF2SS1-6]|uniref:Uncharacterized protein n=1 Tax=Lentinus tigrinus ALCF2SS1-6 TaxID=1328759 RepID=A0A5C2S038_9APHY|nr:hypothetical protein L227DRAFT_656062 [Lentinus tigrinus ALCF2SS1-6]